MPLPVSVSIHRVNIKNRYRRRGIAAALLRLLAGWVREQRAVKVCVDVNADSPAAEPFYSSQGASALNTHWYVWPDIAIVPHAASRLKRRDASHV